MSFLRFVTKSIIAWVGAMVGIGGFVMDAIGIASLGLTPHWWQTLGAAIFFSGVLFVLWKHGGFAKKDQLQSITPQPLAQSKVEEFYRTFDNRLLVEAEEIITTEANAYPSGNARERFLVRTFASTLWTAVFEHTIVLIFKSQILCLEALNRSSMEIDSAQQFYASGALSNTTFYENYPFRSWFEFLTSCGLARIDGNMASITVRGQEFLKYLIHTRRSADNFKN